MEIIDGKQLAKKTREKLKYEVEDLKKEETLQKLKLIIHHEILPLIRRNPSFKQHLINNKNVKIISIKHPLKTFLTIGDDFMSLALFFKDGHYDDSQIYRHIIKQS